MTAGGQGFDGVERRGLMFVLSSPSGAGKTTLSRMLIDRDAGLQMSVSATTRPMRPGEVEGRDYLFRRPAAISRRWSKQQRTAGMGHRVRQSLRHAARAGRGGAGRRAGRAVRYRLAGHAAIAREGSRSDVVSVFILPPSAADLEQRLHTRAQDSDDGHPRPHEDRASHELSHLAEYDYIVVNRQHRLGLRRCNRSCRPSGSSANGRSGYRVRTGLAAAAGEITGGRQAVVVCDSRETIAAILRRASSAV